MSEYCSLEELARDLGEPARLRVLANAGGQCRYIPRPENVPGSPINQEFGPEIALWLSARYAAAEVEFPSSRQRHVDEQARLLRVAVMDAGLTNPTRSANDIASEFGVTVRRIRQIRQELGELDKRRSKPAPLPLFEI
ncbi:MAG: hypothetical protein JJ894_03250 [Dinoroseobacter sp.]|nr:hypothetical protein [Dinoroseobacter sp.]